MANTKLFKNGNSQAVRIPAELAYSTWDVDLVIERQGDELRIRPAQRRMGDVLGKLAKFSPDFMAQGRGENIKGERDSLRLRSTCSTTSRLRLLIHKLPRPMAPSAQPTKIATEMLWTNSLHLMLSL